jgi:hypothetical protein
MCQHHGLGDHTDAQSGDVLLVEGYPVYAPRFAGITVYATHVTTKALQATKRTEQTTVVSKG